MKRPSFHWGPASSRLEWLVVTTIFAYLALLVFLVNSVHAQDHGSHPTDFDPYLTATSIAGTNCCHGKDCKPYYGPAPKRTEKNGVWGWQLGKHWFRDDQQIRPSTMHEEVRGEPTICVGESPYDEGGTGGKTEIPRCFYFPGGV